MQVDNRMRAWYQKDMTIGLLYLCSLGEPPNIKWSFLQAVCRFKLNSKEALSLQNDDI